MHANELGFGCYINHTLGIIRALGEPLSSNMKGFTLLLASLALWFNPAWSLECFFCVTQTNAQSCVQTQTCAENEKVCKTIEYSAPSTFPFDAPYVVVKGCAASCKQDDPDELGTAQPTFCCNTDFCNTRGLDNTCSGTIHFSLSLGLFMCFISVVLVFFRTHL
ncbi:ly6/PLAUR domain-containing protein 2-like [Pelobates fuscus]|uniref:ly6/PLAUR domain-containing protein 2-like n=1 Tax=Pelobates fuscus TaxID=191477 RepID=UPI002FE48AD6